MSAADDAPRAPAVDEALHTTVDADFEDAVLGVQLEHELVGFETVSVSRLDEMIEGMLGDTVARCALVVVCHPEIARDALEIDPTLGAMLPCTTLVYEREGDDRVHVHHLSVTKALRDLGAPPSGADAAMDRLVERTGELMGQVWENIDRYGASAPDGG